MVRPCGAGTEESWADIARRAKYRVSGLCALYKRNRLWLWRLWRRQCGCSPKAWLKEKRIEAAKTLVVAGNAISKVAKLLGYATASHFTNEFRAFMAQTARQYRKRAQWERHEKNRAEGRVEKRVAHST